MINSWEKRTARGRGVRAGLPDAPRVAAAAVAAPGAAARWRVAAPALLRVLSVVEPELAEGVAKVLMPVARVASLPVAAAWGIRALASSREMRPAVAPAE